MLRPVAELPEPIAVDTVSSVGRIVLLFSWCMTVYFPVKTYRGF
ncbi:MAG: hypothetical protein WAK91_01050 [Candidatus Acidiferrales bacterium]|jgi:hypothetical protein